MDDNTQKFSLTFSKVIAKKNLKNSALHHEAPKIIEKIENISSFDKESKLPEADEQENNLVIPMVKTNRDAIFKSLIKKSNTEKQIDSTSKELKYENLSLDEKATIAILEESNKKLEEINERNSNDLLIQPDASRSLTDIDTSAQGKISTLEDYDEVNVESFGSAMLRGMGWKKDKGIGKNNKRVVEIIDPSSKSFALLDFELQKKRQDRNFKGNKGDLEEGEEELNKGSYILVERGRYKGKYGIIESIDEDHVLVRLAREDKVVREVEMNIRVVSAKEYKDLSRVINKDMYDEYKAAELRKKKDKKKEKEDEEFFEDLRKMKRNDGVTEAKDSIKKTNEKVKRIKIENSETLTPTKEYNSSGSNHGLRNKNEEDYLKEKLKKIKELKMRNTEKSADKTRRDLENIGKYADISDKSSDKYFGKTSKKSNEAAEYCKRYKDEPRNLKCKTVDRIDMDIKKQTVIPWARENLKVRIIDKKYKDGRYHKSKVIVCSIDSLKCCTCRSEEGKILYDVNPNNLETVIPKNPSATVLIIKGTHKGQKARILELHKDKEKASVQLLDDFSVILKLSYDDICEYVTR